MKRLPVTFFKKWLVLMAAIFIYTSVNARQDTSRYALILDFYSIGTGTPGDEPLKNFISAYRKKNKLKPLAATRVGGLGREGEYAIILPLKELTTKQKKLFITNLAKALPSLKAKTELGGIHLNENQPFDMSRERLKSEMMVL